MDAVFSCMIAFYFHSEQGRCACVKMLIPSLVTLGGGEEEREIEGDGT